MAATLRLGFRDAGGEAITYNYKYADVTKAASVRPLMEGIVANNAIFTNPPVTIDFAEYVVTTTTPITL